MYMISYKENVVDQNSHFAGASVRENGCVRL